MLNLFRRASSVRGTAEALYAKVVAQARRPEFYTDLGVPDTADGRFELIALHAFLVLRRLKAEPGAGELSQVLFDHMFANLDQNLREMGIGDLSIGRHVKALAEGFYGRIAAYDAGLAEGDSVLGEAFRRNLYRHTTPSDEALAGMSAYLRREAAALDCAGVDALRKGEFAFGPAPNPGVPA
jgi:cytochrome b pre-mRNA-processing protein 3